MTSQLTKILLLFAILVMTLGYSVLGGGGGGIAGLEKTCRYLENPVDGQDLEALFGHFTQDVTAISFWCRTEGGVDVDMHLYQDDDGSKTTFTTGTDITCINGSPTADEGFTDDFTDLTIEAGNEVGLVITEIDGGVTTINVCLEFE